MTTPIEHGVSQLPAEVELNRLKDWIDREVVPVLRTLRDMANEQGTKSELAHTGDYSWNLDGEGRLFIEQASGDIALSVAGTVDLTKLRQGRVYHLVILNTSGVDVDVTFSSDFLASGATIATGNTGGWDFVVKDVDMTAITATLVEVS